MCVDNNSGPTHSKAGLHLLRVQNITTALSATTTTSTASAAVAEGLNNKSAEMYFREAVIRRSQYDASLLEYERITALQKTRIRIEDHASTNFQASVLQPRKVAGPYASSSNSASAAVGVGGESAHTNVSSSSGSSGTMVNDDAEDRQAAKRPRLSDSNETAPVPPISTSTSTSVGGGAAAATTGGAEKVVVAEVEEELEFDLEDLVGGPIPTASSSRFANITTKPTTTAASQSNNSNNSHVYSSGSSSYGNSNNSNIAGVRGVANVKTEVNVNSSSNSALGSGGVKVKVEGGTTAKKVGMKPRPKFVIS